VYILFCRTTIGSDGSAERSNPIVSSSKATFAVYRGPTTTSCGDAADGQRGAAAAGGGRADASTRARRGGYPGGGGGSGVPEL